MTSILSSVAAVIPFNDDNTIAFTRGQKELVDAGIAAGICKFEMSVNDTATRIRIETTRLPNVEQVRIEAKWLPTGRFHSCWIETGVATGAVVTKKSQTLKPAIVALERHAKKVATAA